MFKDLWKDAPTYVIIGILWWGFIIGYAFYAEYKYHISDRVHYALERAFPLPPTYHK